MPYKDPKVRKEKHAEYSRKYYEKNKEKVMAANNVVKARGKEKWELYKGSLKCARCDENHIACMDFHHLDPAEKEYEVSKLVGNGMYTKAYKEIKKCIVLCANCHRKEHYVQQHLKIE
jgi:hypothetical protein